MRVEQLDRHWKGHQPLLVFDFPPSRAPKMLGSQQLFFGGRLVSRIFAEFQHPAIQTKIVQQKNKSAPAKREKRFYTNRVPKKQEVGGIFVWSGLELLSFFKYSRSKLKNQKPIAVDVLIKAYPTALLSCRSNLAGRKVRLYLLHVKCRKETMKKITK